MSGEVAEIVTENSLGQFGDNPLQAQKLSGMKRLRKCPRIIINNSNKDIETKCESSTTIESRKNLSLTSPRDNDRKLNTLSTLHLSIKESDMITPRGIERGSAKSLKTLEDSLSQRGSGKKLNQGTPLAKNSSSKGVNKMRVAVRVMTALRGMQKGKKRSEAEMEYYGETKEGTLQYLDNEQEDSDETSEASERKGFEDFVSKYGNVIRYIGKGESFGELGLKKNAKRSASIVCRTDCEFIVLGKQEYDMVFGKVQKEKEEFLKTVFPNLDTNSMSTGNFNYLISSFKVR